MHRLHMLLGARIVTDPVPTVLLMLAVEKDADEPDHVASMRFAEDRRSLMELSEVRW